MSKVLKIRHSITGDIRRVVLASWPDLAGLDINLRQIFGAELPSPYTLRYADQEGDQISITSNIELREAIEAARGGILTLTLSPATSAAASVTIPSAAPARQPQSRPAVKPYAYPSPQSIFPDAYASSPHGIRAPGASIPFPDMSVTTSQAHDTLFIDDIAPPSFRRDFHALVAKCPSRTNGALIWEQIRDTLIDFGGDAAKASEVLRTAPARPSVPTSRYYFSVSFARSAADLAAAGFSLPSVVAALIRNGGVVTNAALELSGSATTEHCPKGHLLEISSYNVGNYASGWYCDRCACKSPIGQRWFCMECKFDVCFNCLPKPTALIPAKLIPQPVVPIVSDMSLPPNLVEPVRMLEAMGFNDRMKVIEALVKNAGDIVRCANQLAEERRVNEEKEAQAARQAERQRRKAEAERQRQEARLRAEEERKLAEARRLEQQRSRELEAKRGEAAKVLVKTPEKMGHDLAYLMGMGFDTVSSTTSLVNAGGDLNAALEELLRLQNE